MNDLLERCCGLDIHKDIIAACILDGAVGQKASSEIREFSTLIPGMQALKEWIISQNCRHVAMESTGIYWQPVYETLEEAFNGEISLLVVNARHMKNVPGKKTDMRDAEWIATLLRAGLLNGSFVPNKDIREFRRLTRYRKGIVRDITSQKNRVEKFLQSSGFRLSTFISDVFGASGRDIIEYLAQYGRIGKEQINLCLRTKTRHKIDDIMIAVNGTLSDKQRLFLRMLLSHLDTLYAHLRDIERVIGIEVEQFSAHLAAICSMPGIAQTAAAAVIAEIGIDMSRFKTAEHICSRAGLSPGNNESAGKKNELR